MKSRDLMMGAGLALLLCGAAAAATKPAKAAGNPALGKQLFTQQCMLCHSDKAGQEGAAPSLAGVVGRKAASDTGFPAYSKALKASGLTWTTANLDKWLSGPPKLVPGTSMPIALPAAADRQNVIAYLSSLKH